MWRWAKVLLDGKLVVTGRSVGWLVAKMGTVWSSPCAEPGRWCAVGKPPSLLQQYAPPGQPCPNSIAPLSTFDTIWISCNNVFSSLHWDYGLEKNEGFCVLLMVVVVVVVALNCSSIPDQLTIGTITWIPAPLFPRMIYRRNVRESRQEDIPTGSVATD